MRFILLTVILAGISLYSFASKGNTTNPLAATDSLIIQGKILNLTGRLYRQAPNITFSRNNILQPQLELSKQAALAADGSFRVSLPMIYNQEEIYLDYGGKAFTTFLGSPGTVEIVFDGDSIQKAKKLFYFAGVNAAANNQYSAYLAEENKILSTNTVLGSKFYETFWDKSTDEAIRTAAGRAELRTSVLPRINANTIPDPSLSKWVTSLAEDERIQNLYEYSLSNRLELARTSALIDSLKRLQKAPLTAQKVTLANRFGNYADQKVEEKKYNNPSRSSSLPVRLMASLIKNNASKLTGTEIARLDDIAVKGIAEKTELDFINQLYAKNEAVLNLLFAYERESRTYSDLFDSTAREFLKARYLPKNFYKYTYPQQILLSKHIQGRLSVPQFGQSLDEIVNIEVKDSANIKKMSAFKDIRAEPTETLPGYYLSVSNERGTTWLNRVLDKYKGKTIYMIKWNFEDAKSREELEYIASLQAQLPEDVVFLYIHLPADDMVVSDDLVKQYIVRHRLKGVHLFLNSDQTMDLLFKLNPIEPGTFAILKPNGKYSSKNALAPSAMEKTIQAILQAGSK
ncbi:hypothetical protein [Dyadobacter sp. NIV53]|uniref:hypothetical protein n=1 Tax=Dyadobacter sp. NIV53 TaxID=2861765 RepID=UPI001C8866CD|nr:hypothetical protein [Dyadobacter sp. NIV53]